MHWQWIHAADICVKIKWHILMNSHTSRVAAVIQRREEANVCHVKQWTSRSDCNVPTVTCRRWLTDYNTRDNVVAVHHSALTSQALSDLSSPGTAHCRWQSAKHTNNYYTVVVVLTTTVVVVLTVLTAVLTVVVVVVAAAVVVVA